MDELEQEDMIDQNDELTEKEKTVIKVMDVDHRLTFDVANLIVDGYEKKLAELEKAGKLKAVITQNIDGLHQAAGSKEVLELHGSVLRNYCSKCGKRFDSTDEDVYAGVKYIQAAAGVPKCDECGGKVRPDVVLYEEGLDNYVISRTIEHISKADMLIIGGTSLVVYPAASFINYFNGKHLAVLNMASTGRDSQADIVIHDKIGEVLSQITV